MASYILYGKDENGKNSIERSETTDDGMRRYNTFQRASERVLSLDELMENPLFDHEQLKSPHKRSPYNKSVRTVRRPRYDKKTGELIDPGDSDVPGMTEVWDTIDRLDKWIMQLEGKIPPDENTLLFEDSYRLYRLKHQLVEIRRNQYDLLDSYKPVLKFQSLDHPKTQFYDLCGDSFYWIPIDEWQRRVDHSYTHTISRNLSDYETRETPNGTEVKWVIYRHNFDWTNTKHIQAFINFYSEIDQQVHEKVDTYSKTLFWDFDRYRKAANLSPLKNYMLDLKLQKYPYEDIIDIILREFGISFHLNHISTVFMDEIPRKIALAAAKNNAFVDTPKNKMVLCPHCQRLLPPSTLFFSQNKARTNGLSRLCKECDRAIRVKKGKVKLIDGREKIAQMP